MGRNCLDTPHIIRNTIFAILVCPNIRAKRHRPGIGLQVRHEIVEPFIVEAHPVDHGPVFRQAEQPRLRIARLRTRRHCSALHKTKTILRHRRWHIAILVKACGQPNRTVQRQAGFWQRNCQRCVRRWRVDRHAQTRLQQADRSSMRRFRGQHLDGGNAKISQAHDSIPLASLALHLSRKPGARPHRPSQFAGAYTGAGTIVRPGSFPI